MGIGKGIALEINEWVGVAMVVVVASLVLIQFKGVSGITAALNSTIEKFVSAFAEPANWVAIVIIAIIGYAIIRMFQNGGDRN